MNSSSDQTRKHGEFLHFQESWLKKYTAHSRRQYKRATSRYLEWCETNGRDPLAASNAELDAFVSSAAAHWGPSTARVTSYAIGSYFRHLYVERHGRIGIELAPRPAPMPATRGEPDRSARWVSLDQAVALLDAAGELGPTHLAVTALLIETGISMRAICRLRGRDIGWASDRPLGRVIVRHEERGEALGYAVTDGLFGCLSQLYREDDEILIAWGEPPRPLRPETVARIVGAVVRKAGLPARIRGEALRAFAQERNRRKRAAIRMDRGFEKRIRMETALDTVPLDQRPPDPSREVEEPLGAWVDGLLRIP